MAIELIFHYALARLATMIIVRSVSHVLLSAAHVQHPLRIV
jgi:hypothetical protein